MVADKIAQLQSAALIGPSDSDNILVLHSSGVYVDQKCWGIHGKKEFSQLITKTLSHGLQCLEELETEQSHDHAFKFVDFISSDLPEDNLKIYCSENVTKFSSPDWESKAYASAGHEEDKSYNSEHQMVHPYISLRPEALFSKSEMKKLLFHEFFHNQGYKHGTSIEFANACEECCFLKEDWGQASPTIQAERRHQLACKICAGDYENEVAYFQDAYQWLKGSFDSWILLNHLIYYLKSDRDSRVEAILLNLLQEELPAVAEKLTTILSDGCESCDDIPPPLSEKEKISVIAAQMIAHIMQNDNALAGRQWNLLKEEIRVYEYSDIDKGTEKLFFLGRIRKVQTAGKNLIPLWDIITNYPKKRPSNNLFDFLNGQ